MENKIILLIRRILIIMLIFWMISVFFLSNQSGDKSGALSKKVALYITFGNEQATENIEPTIRKVAHILEYSVGAMLFFGILITYEKYTLLARIIMTITFILVYSGLDEFHQSFINARSGNWIDILIDSFGGALGIGASYLVEGIIRAMDSKVQEKISQIR